MKIVIIGGGLLGVTSAYFLRRFGHEVTLIERASGSARETSFANGALLTPSMSDPWNSPGCWRTLLGSLVRSDSALQIRLRALPFLASWGVEFLRNSRPADFFRNTASNLRLALYSREVMELLRSDTGIEYARMARGAVKLFRSSSALDSAMSVSERLAADGLRFRRLSRAEVTELEPMLRPIAHELSGGLHYEDDEVGDAHWFCESLAEHSRSSGVTFRFGTEVRDFQSRSGRVNAVVTSQGSFSGDCFIIAAGSYSAPLLRKLGLHLPVQPAKGYSITFDKMGEEALRIPLVDNDLHAVIVPVAGRMRVAGTAEFAGFDLSLRPERVRNLIELLRRVLPQAIWDAHAGSPWCGLRPMSADGVPIIGATPIENVFVNTGHGHLGWTLAAGSGQLLADLIDRRSVAIDPQPYFLNRFARR